MKRCTFVFVSFVICVLIFQLTCGRQAKAADEPNTSTPQSAQADPNAQYAAHVSGPNDLEPVLKLESALYDFGDVGVRTTNVCQFKFTNIGKAPLVIKEVKSTCGCAVPALPKTEYAPEESGTVEVRFTAPGDEGDIVKHLYIQSNDRKNPDTELIIRAKVLAKVKVEPQIIKLSLKEENAGCPPIKLQSTDGVPFAITRFEATAGCLTVDLDPNVANTEFALRPKVDADKLRKVLNGAIDIGLSHPQCSSAHISFEATPVYTLNPPMIMVLKAKPENPITREVWVLNNYKEPFEIESVSSQKGFVKLLSTEKQDSGYKLVVEIAPPSTQTKVRIFSDTIFVNIKGGEKLEINCRGFFERDLKKVKQ